MEKKHVYITQSQYATAEFLGDGFDVFEEATEFALVDENDSENDEYDSEFVDEYLDKMKEYSDALIKKYLEANDRGCEEEKK